MITSTLLKVSSDEINKKPFESFGLGILESYVNGEISELEFVEVDNDHVAF